MSSEAVTRIHIGGTAGTEPYDVLVGRQTSSASWPG
ncbi:hypothetical protein SGRIM128S_05618 [Streptomyces griseomycini]